jgi:hypothetical protein
MSETSDREITLVETQEREREWLNQYTGWLKGIFADPPKQVSHPQHAEVVRRWLAAEKELDEATRAALIYKRERKAEHDRCAPLEATIAQQAQRIETLTAALRRMREEFSCDSDDTEFYPCGDSLTYLEACEMADAALSGPDAAQPSVTASANPGAPGSIPGPEITPDG